MPIFGKALGSILGGYSAGQGLSISLLNDTVKVMMTTSSYTPNQDTHQYKSDVTNEVTGTAYTAGGQALTSKTLTYNSSGHATTFSAANADWASSTISAARYAVIYKDTGTGSTSPLLAYIDFGSNQSSSAGDFVIQWSGSGIAQWSAS